MIGGLMSGLKSGSQGNVQSILDPMGIMYKAPGPTPGFLQDPGSPQTMPTPQDTDRVAWLQAFGIGGQ